ncbi:hypothetical protein MCOR25_008547 [Pyricularia grisea]|uniref:Tryptophan synthase beta chain-like PALP domain-containing protein n=1 Tax=Pyricularia grisea TaxID=148305 RepID=A0A6P8BKS2_PYRGI|nr:uncharacterized protein PgNI_01542 [Pyricularia grisea]KAI6354563.1 hypothetical protein MCOR25_008547 [Pyricularia grisea]TLD17398.1 hypothetical protein PgNI_01542 [Pyricularia grisea]
MADPATSPPLERASIFAAHELIKPYVHRTPVLTNATLTALASTPRTAEDLRATRWADRADRPARPVLRLWFKCENFQRIGAFKPRGAFHAVERLKLIPGWLEGQGRTNGVVTASSGNHAQALALAARTSGIPAHIVIPSIAPAPKLAATKALGATIYRSGSTSAEREAVAAKVVADTGGRYIPPYDHPDIILGQGTLGLEMQEQVEALMAGGDGATAGGDFTRRGQTSGTQTQDGGEKKKGLDAIMAPCGGGGMLSGVALSCEGTGIRVFGAEPEFQGADECKRSFEAGQRIDTVKSLTIADGLRTPVGKYPWSIIYERRLVSQMFNVTEDEIKDALRLILERFKLVVEPSGAVPLAVALFNEDFRAMVETEAGENGWDLGIVLSGGNVSLEMLGKLFPEGLPA